VASGPARSGDAPSIPRRWVARRRFRGLPDFPWDRLAPYAARARSHPQGIVDLSVGTPVDPTPPVVQEALAAAADAPGYPVTYGTVQLREAVAGWFARRLGIPGVNPDGVLPTIGSKELVAWLPILSGLGPGDMVAFPALAYPTYDLGARLAGAEPVATEDVTRLDPDRLALIWLNSPSNPTGAVLPVAEMRRVVDWGRSHGVLVISDECYLELGWEAEPVSILDPRVCDGSHEGILAVGSLSKRSNLAGYRAAFLAGDVTVVQELLQVRKHAGMMVPAPVQQAMITALGDDAHVREQHARYAARRTALYGAFVKAGFRIDHSQAGLYLWATRDESCWSTVEWLAGRGILVAPGEFYGAAGTRHVRIALTAVDERIHAAVARLEG
jgi:succinyldiaminopimelate transaminase